jgi:hypothetical protein
MGYRLVTTQQLGAIWAQLKLGESGRAISRYLGIDRKRVNHCAERILDLNIPPEATKARFWMSPRSRGLGEVAGAELAYGPGAVKW